jgi:hypothetical protein
MDLFMVFLVIHTNFGKLKQISLKLKNRLSTRMNGHWISSNNFWFQSTPYLTNCLLIPVRIHMYFINYPLSTSHITCCHLELTYLIIISCRHSPQINFFLFSLHPLHSFLPVYSSGSSYPKESCGAICTVC